MAGRALGLPDDWATIVDRDIAAAVIAHGAFEHPGPFFYLMNLINTKRKSWSSSVPQRRHSIELQRQVPAGCVTGTTMRLP